MVYRAQLSSSLDTMRTVLVLATVVAVALANAVPTINNLANLKTIDVDAATVERQHKVLELFTAVDVLNINALYYKVGLDYDIQANIDKYEKKEVVADFFKYYEKDFIPGNKLFTIFNEKMREQAVALYDLFYYAKDLDTLYKTAAWARIHVNGGMFVYTFYQALIQRLDTKDLVLPAFYEIVPDLYANYEVYTKMYFSRSRGEPFEEFPDYGIVKDGNEYLFYSNYSDYYTYGDESKLAYLTEDIGWNSFYAYFHRVMPFWEKGDDIFMGIFKERRGEFYYYFYQQLLARYYMERLSNGLGEIPRFSWYQPFKQGYRPYLTSGFHPLAQRSDNYIMQNEHNLDDLRFVRNYEDMFLSFLEQGQFSAYHKQVDFSNSKSINFVGNFWQSNPDLHEKLSLPRYNKNSYEQAARRILGGAPINNKYQGYEVFPSALDFYHTSLRDPAFYQLYNKIVGFMLKYKQYLQPYTQESLHYVGVKVNNVEVSKLETFFDFYKFNASNAIFYTNEELAKGTDKQFAVVQPRLNNNVFKVKISVKSDVEQQATIKVFVGPKYDSYGTEIKFEDNWMNFVGLDWFTQKLTKGENVFERSSNDFFYYKNDDLSTAEIYSLLGKGKLPVDMLENYDNLPKRLMLPRGTKGGFPLQFFVVVYKSVELPKELEGLESDILDDKPFGYPLDRPASEYFLQPNMYVKDVVVYHKGSEYPNSYNVAVHSNESTKH